MGPIRTVQSIASWARLNCSSDIASSISSPGYASSSDGNAGMTNPRAKIAGIPTLIRPSGLWAAEDLDHAGNGSRVQIQGLSSPRKSARVNHPHKGPHGVQAIHINPSAQREKENVPAFPVPRDTRLLCSTEVFQTHGVTGESASRMR